MERSSRGGGRGGRGGRSGHAGRGGANAGITKNADSHGKANSIAAASAPAREKYIVIITNVENDFAKVHQDRLPAFLCLDPARKGAASLPASRRDGEDVKDDSSRRFIGCGSRAPPPPQPECFFELHCRSETRSAELTIYGTADAAVSTVFTTRHAPHGKEQAGQDAKSSMMKATRGESGKRETAAAHDGEAATTNEGDESDRTAMKKRAGGDAAESLTNAHVNRRNSHAFDSLADMAAVMAERPYFTHPVALRVNLPGHEAGSELTLSDACMRRLSWKLRPARKSGARAQKRSREEGGKDDFDAESGSGKSVHSDSDSDKEEEKSANATTKTEERKGTEKSARAADAVQKSSKLNALEDAPVITRPRQFPSRQKDLVTAVAAIYAAQWTARQVREQLRDLPGFLSCWRLYAKHYRVVFQNQESLFHAKQLLDQFQLDGGVRVALTLSDALTRRNAEFLAREEAAVDAPRTTAAGAV